MLAEQIYAFILSVIGGLGLGIGYDLYRTLVGKRKQKVWWRSLSDYLIWVIGAVLFFLLLLWGNWGEVRAYLFVGLGAGLLAYFQWLTGEVRAFWEGMVKLIAFLGISLLDLVLWPFRFLQRLLGKIRHLLRKAYHRWGVPLRRKGQRWGGGLRMRLSRFRSSPSRFKARLRSGAQFPLNWLRSLMK